MTDLQNSDCPDLCLLRPDHAGELPAGLRVHLQECEDCRSLATLAGAFAAQGSLSERCDEMTALLAVFSVGTLADTDRARLERHLAECSGCLVSATELLLGDAQPSGAAVVAIAAVGGRSRSALWWGGAAVGLVAAAAAVLMVMRVPSDSLSNELTARDETRPNRSNRPGDSKIVHKPAPAAPARGVGFWRATHIVGLSGAKASHRRPPAFVYDGKRVTMYLPATNSTSPSARRHELTRPARWQGDLLQYRLTSGAWRSLARFSKGEFWVTTRVAVASAKVVSVATWRLKRVVDLRGLSAAERKLVAGSAKRRHRHLPPARYRVASSGSHIEVVARLLHFTRKTFHCGTMAVSVAMKYRVQRIVRGTYPHRVLYVNHLCPELSRVSALGKGGGNLKKFVVGDSHLLVLRKVNSKTRTSPGSLTSGRASFDGYGNANIPRFWADRTDLAVPAAIPARASLLSAATRQGKYKATIVHYDPKTKTAVVLTPGWPPERKPYQYDGKSWLPLWSPYSP